MATISVNGRIFPDIQLIAFDKDGTLVDFNHLWGERTRVWINWLVGHGGKVGNGRNNLYLALCDSLGFDPQTNRIINDSPLAVASVPKICTIAATVFYQHGLDWLEAEELVAASLPDGINALPTAQEVLPIGNVEQTIERLVSAGVDIAVVTSDGRTMTRAILTILGIEDFVHFLICGDDDVPNKPAPDALWAIGRQLNIDASQMLMVGDTASDMVFGRNAGAAGCIGVRGGAGNLSALSQTADEVIDSIEAIRVIHPPGGWPTWAEPPGGFVH
jgi:phosphoglycolate phosphatase-like HAD superfamily hydrolase